ncbi:hypothetical protein PVAG01_06868 [Phlyctema vagabunda]|uniref:Uncharacterized protein n=1 Tax=Phlyctema vagabunda TaxID=108571 RepID=A0ABR4PH99_9HELO
MFDLPDAKRVRRSDLYTRSRSSSRSRSPSPPDAAISAQLQSQLAKLYGPLATSETEPASFREQRIAVRGSEEKKDALEEEQVFEFRLFSKTTDSAAPDAAQRIVIDEEDLGEGAFVQPRRDLSYYLVGKAEGERKRGLEIMALSGEDVLKGKERRHWGLEVPWRVQVLKVQKVTKGEKKIIAIEGEEEKRKRPGKKRRILVREKKKVKDQIEEKLRIERERKEESEKDKRTRRNREKKVKRKAKEKAEKAKQAGGNEVNNATPDGVGASAKSVDEMDVDQISDD